MESGTGLLVGRQAVLFAQVGERQIDRRIVDDAAVGITGHRIQVTGLHWPAVQGQEQLAPLAAQFRRRESQLYVGEGRGKIAMGIEPGQLGRLQMVVGGLFQQCGQRAIQRLHRRLGFRQFHLARLPDSARQRLGRLFIEGLRYRFRGLRLFFHPLFATGRNCQEPATQQHGECVPKLDCDHKNTQNLIELT